MSLLQQSYHLEMSATKTNSSDIKNFHALKQDPITSKYLRTSLTGKIPPGQIPTHQTPPSKIPPENFYLKYSHPFHQLPFFTFSSLNTSSINGGDVYVNPPKMNIFDMSRTAQCSHLRKTSNN